MSSLRWRACQSLQNEAARQNLAVAHAVTSPTSRRSTRVASSPWAASYRLAPVNFTMRESPFSFPSWLWKTCHCRSVLSVPIRVPARHPLAEPRLGISMPAGRTADLRKHPGQISVALGIDFDPVETSWPEVGQTKTSAPIFASFIRSWWGKHGVRPRPNNTRQHEWLIISS